MKHQIIWDAGKAYFRELAMRSLARERRKENSKMNDIMENLKESEQIAPGDSRNQQIRQKIVRLQNEITIIQTEEMERNLRFAKQNFFENANQPGRWWVYPLKKE